MPSGLNPPRTKHADLYENCSSACLRVGARTDESHRQVDATKEHWQTMGEHARKETRPLVSQYETHHGYGFNVKDHTLYRVDPDEVLGTETVGAIYESFQEGFWRDAQQVAREHGFQEMYSEGRSGGWAILEPQPDPDYLSGLECYNLARKLRVIERELGESMAYWRAEFEREVSERIASELAEPAERAYWAARDVETV